VQLHELRLGRNALGDEGAAALAPGLSHSALSLLSLSGCEISAEGARAVANAIEGHRTLRSLSLADNRLEGADGCRAAQRLVLGCGPLQRLWLGGNPLGPAAFDALAPAGAHHAARLTHLWLERSAAGAAGPGVARLLRASMGTLQSLWLGGNRLLDDAAVALASVLLGETRVLSLLPAPVPSSSFLRPTHLLPCSLPQARAAAPSRCSSCGSSTTSSPSRARSRSSRRAADANRPVTAWNALCSLRVAVLACVRACVRACFAC